MNLINDWKYRLDQNKIILNQYTGNDKDLVIHNKYQVDGVTYNAELGKRLIFIDKKNFNTITFEDEVCKHITYCMKMFFHQYNCIQINGLQYFDTIDCFSMKQMFDGCHHVKELNVSSFNTSNVETMQGMFNECHTLTYLDVSNFDTSKVENMSSMFNYCAFLEELDLRNFDVRNVKDMHWMFLGCMHLKRILVSRDKWIISDDCNTENMFYKCGVDHVTYVD